MITDAPLAAAPPPLPAPAFDAHTHLDLLSEPVDEVLAGARGPAREAVVLNAAAALWLADVAPDLRECAEKARLILDEGSALRKLDALAHMTSTPSAEVAS